MLNLLSRVRIVSDFYDVDWDGDKGIVNGREGVVTDLDTTQESPLFTVLVLVDPAQGEEELGFYARELEVLDA